MNDPLATLGVDPADLDMAPSGRPPTHLVRARLAPPSPAACTVCGDMAVATRIVMLDEEPRWLDLCRSHLLAATGWSVGA
ncbi:hypothetical protein ACIRF8_15720 [Streptomyces sp. NPDC102406]|uniref:hypothetical protein n=1 Tax=Streptomyces sp. NPDC102406 TaxID=3366171 RepID=UPI0037FD8F18